MIDRALDQGIAPDVTIVDGIVYVAYGTVPHALILVRLRLDGTEIGRDVLPNGFDQSFPRFSGPWLVYRQDEAHGFAATALNIVNGQTWTYGQAGATFGLTVNADLGLCAYEWRTGQEPWRIWFGSLHTGQVSPTTQEGAPDGLDSILPLQTVTLRALTRGDVPGIWYPVRAGNLTVGELRDEPGRPQGGIGVQLESDVLRVALDAQNTPNPRCAAAGDTHALVCWGQTVRLLLASEAELRALPPVVASPMPIPPVPPLPVPKPPTAPPVLPSPQPPKEPSMPLSVADIRAIRNELVRFYMEPDGLNRRVRSIPEPIVYYDRGIEEWDAVALAHGVEEAKRQIRTFPEWKAQHQGDPVNPQ